MTAIPMAAAARDGGPVSRGRGYELRTLLLLGLAFGFAFFDRNAVTFLGPYVVRDLRLSNTQVGALGSGLAVTWALGAYLVGRWSDGMGRRKPFLLAALVIFSCCSLASGLATGFGSLFAARAVMGAVEGPFLPICLAIIAGSVAAERRGVMIGTLQNGFGSLIGSVAAPLVLVAMAEAAGWRSAFYLSGLPGLVCALLIWRLVDEPRAPAAPAAPADTSIPAMFRHRNMVICCLVAGFMVPSLLLGQIFLPLYFTQVRGFSPREMSVLMGVLGLCPAVGGVLVAGLSDRLGRRGPLIAGCFLATLCPLAALLFTGPYWLLAGLLFVGWLGIGTFPVFMGVIPAETLGQARAATAMGLVVGAGEISGGVVGPLAGGWAADTWSLALPIWLQAAAAAVAGLIACLVTETNPSRLARRAARG